MDQGRHELAAGADLASGEKRQTPVQTTYLQELEVRRHIMSQVAKEILLLKDRQACCYGVHREDFTKPCSMRRENEETLSWLSFILTQSPRLKSVLEPGGGS